MYTSGSPAAGPGMSNPLTVQSSVVLNARYDRHFTHVRMSYATGRQKPTLGGSINPDDFDVMPRELAMMVRQDFDAEIRRPINYEKDREIRVFTSANAVPWLYDVPPAPPSAAGTSLDPMDVLKGTGARAERARMRDMLVFAGVPLTKVLHGNVNQSDAVSVQVAGSTSIFNTGPYDIQAFDLVSWDIPYSTTEDAFALKVPEVPGERPAPRAPLSIAHSSSMRASCFCRPVEEQDVLLDGAHAPGGARGQHPEGGLLHRALHDRGHLPDAGAPGLQGARAAAEHGQEAQDLSSRLGQAAQAAPRRRHGSRERPCRPQAEGG